MALFENFPYTNLHELNLDWLIDMLNKITQHIRLPGSTARPGILFYILMRKSGSPIWMICSCITGMFSGHLME